MVANATQPRKRLGAWLARVTGTVYQASTDGFVTAYKDAAAGNNLKGQTDSANPPTVIRHWQQASGNGEIGICYPVKKNDYWEITGAADVVFWIPLEP